jgi:hypothetical protein
MQVTSTISQYRDELLPLHHGDEGNDVNGGEGATRSGSGNIPILFPQSSDPYCVFSISPPSHHEIERRNIYIVSFRSRRFCRGEICNN